jgi:hypothetical protein
MSERLGTGGLDAAGSIKLITAGQPLGLLFGLTPRSDGGAILKPDIAAKLCDVPNKVFRLCA